MSLLYFESFDAHGIGDCLGTNNYPNWTTYILPSVTLGVANMGRRSSRGMQIKTYTNDYFFATYSLNAEQTAVVLGFAVKPVSGTANSAFLWILNSAGTVQFVLDCTAAGRVRVKTASAGSVLAESADGAITFNIYQYFEIKFTCDGTDTVQVRVNGADVIASTSGLNLRQAGTGAVGKIKWTGFTTNLSYDYYDDLYIENQSGAKFNDFLGDIKVDAFWPTADATYQQFTSNRATHYDAINDFGGASATYYIEEDTVTQKDSFTLTPTGDLPTIHAIDIRSVSRNSDTGVAECTPFVRYGGVNYNQTPFNRGDTLEYDDTILTQRPDTGGALSKAFLEAMEFGWEFSAAS